MGLDAGGQESGSGHGQGAQNGFIDEVVCIHLVREEETLLLGGKMVIKTGKEAIPAQKDFSSLARKHHGNGVMPSMLQSSGSLKEKGRYMFSHHLNLMILIFFV